MYIHYAQCTHLHTHTSLTGEKGSRVLQVLFLIFNTVITRTAPSFFIPFFTMLSPSSSFCLPPQPQPPSVTHCTLAPRKSAARQIYKILCVGRRVKGWRRRRRYRYYIYIILRVVKKHACDEHELVIILSRASREGVCAAVQQPVPPSCHHVPQDIYTMRYSILYLVYYIIGVLLLLPLLPLPGSYILYYYLLCVRVRFNATPPP